MEKHTPGPWQVAWYPRRNTAEIETVSQEPGSYRHMTNDLPMCAGIGVEDVEIIKKDGREYRYSAEACANARLIAAAPDLLEACEFALLKLSLQEGDKVLGGSQWDEFKSKAKAAIAKAEGKNLP